MATLGLKIASIRPARVSDAPSLAGVEAATSRSAPVLPDEHSEALPGLRSVRYVELIETNAGLVYVAEDNGAVVGYLALQHGVHPAAGGRNPIQLWQLYVVPTFHGSGVAAQLMSVAKDHARRHLHDVIWLGVSEHNARGMAFYLKQGFKALGLHAVGAGDHAHQDIVMSCIVC